MCSTGPGRPLGFRAFFMIVSWKALHPRRFAPPPPAGETGGAWCAGIPAVMQFAEKRKLPASLLFGVKQSDSGCRL
jgi:hypothetical protein